MLAGVLFDPPGPIHTIRVLNQTDGKLNQYRKEEQLFSTPQTQVTVYKDQNNNDTQVVIKAVKRRNPTRDKFQLLRRNNLSRKGALLSTEQSILREIAIMKSCRHANHVRLLEVIDDPKHSRIYMVMEYLQGGRVQWQDDNKTPVLTVNQTRRIFRDVVLGLEYLHYLGIVHRDIKPDNLVWADPNRSWVKIIDYGISHYSPYRRKVPFARWREDLSPLREMSLFPPADMLRLRGTEYFIAPEVVWISDEAPNPPSTASSHTITETAESSNATNTHQSAPSVSVQEHEEEQGGDGASNIAHSSSHPPSPSPPTSSRPPITKAIDIWSLGVTLYCLLFGCLPFEVPRRANQHPNHARFLLYQEICHSDWNVKDTIGADLIKVCGRETTDSASVISLLDKMLQKDPKKRITLGEIKKHPWVLEGIANPQEWLVDTSPANYFMPKPYRWIRRMMWKILAKLS